MTRNGSSRADDRPIAARANHKRPATRRSCRLEARLHATAPHEEHGPDRHASSHRRRSEENLHDSREIDAVQASFRLMDLPPEIRLEIYRACLTRPWNILMSRKSEEQWDLVSTDEDDERQPEGSESAFHIRRRSRRRIPSIAGRERLRRARAPQRNDPLATNILSVSKTVNREARDVLYSENVFELDINTAVTTLVELRQRSRRQIRHVEVLIPSCADICEPFGNVVRLGLRYCSSLRTLVVNTPFTLPRAAASVGAVDPRPLVYTQGFDTLRWLPQQCNVILRGQHNPEIAQAVRRHLDFARSRDTLAYAHRQILSREFDSQAELPS